MKVGILAGGRGTRMASETDLRPKPMVEIGGQPILWHIMKHYASYGHREFAIGCGYRADYIQSWFEDNRARCEDWTIEAVDTGLDTGTGGRIKRLQPFLGQGTCMVTWGDGLADINLDALLAFHQKTATLVTVTAVQPPSRFGHLTIVDDLVDRFEEKPAEHWINGAFFVLEPGAFRYIDGDETMFEQEPLEALAADRQLAAYRHRGFWQCMDDQSDRRRLESLWASGPPWAVRSEEPPQPGPGRIAAAGPRTMCATFPSAANGRADTTMSQTRRTYTDSVDSRVIEGTKP